jgi:hypothetical protein
MKILKIIMCSLILFSCTREYNYTHKICFIENNETKQIIIRYNTLDEGLTKKYKFHTMAKLNNIKIINCK